MDSEGQHFHPQVSDVLALDDESAEVVDKVHTGEILVDDSVLAMSVILYCVIVSIWQDGILIVVLTLEKLPTSFLPDRISYPVDLFMYVNLKA